MDGKARKCALGEPGWSLLEVTESDKRCSFQCVRVHSAVLCTNDKTGYISFPQPTPRPWETVSPGRWSRMSSSSSFKRTSSQSLIISGTHSVPLCEAIKTLWFFSFFVILLDLYGTVRISVSRKAEAKEIQPRTGRISEGTLDYKDLLRRGQRQTPVH